MPYLLKTHRLTPINSLVKIIREADLSGVVLVENDKGDRHSVRVEWLGYEAIEVKPEIANRKKPESRKALTQAEKIQLEYLNSLK